MFRYLRKVVTVSKLWLNQGKLAKAKLAYLSNNSAEEFYRAERLRYRVRELEYKLSRI